MRLSLCSISNGLTTCNTVHLWNPWFSHIHKPLFLLMKKVECKIFNSFSSTGENHAALGIVSNEMLSIDSKQ
jgi:hypothetical protein